MSDSVRNYPVISWKAVGMRPLQVGLIFATIVTSLAGILSNPLFVIADSSVTSTPMLQVANHRTEQAIALVDSELTEAPAIAND
jgi:NAD(P)H-quinone oxidoreductase subunit 2